MDELETYQQKSQRQSVLLFPILPSRLRFLIHKLTEDLPVLTTFSVGECWCRRVVVCHSELRAELDEDTNNSVCEEPVRGREETEGVAKPKSSTPSGSRGQKRPDKALYMPRAARERLSQHASKQSAVCKELPSPASSSCSCIGSSSDSCSCCETPENTELSKQECLPIATNYTEDISAYCLEEKKKFALKLHEDEPHEWDQTMSCFADMTLEEAVKAEEDDLDRVSYSNQTEDKSTDTDDVTAEIKAHLKEAVSFFIEHIHSDFSVYEPDTISPNELRHVIEIYDFPSMFKTDDLLDAFNNFSDGGLKITWVDNTHALGIFSSESAALHALSICHPLLKTRTLAKGSKKSKGKAFRRAEFIQPVKERPRTDCAVARRMVTRALGLQGQGRVMRY